MKIWLYLIGLIFLFAANTTAANTDFFGERVEVAAKGRMKATESVIKGFTQHGTNQAVTQGFKTADVLKIIREGNAVEAMGRFGAQTRYTLGGNTVVVNAQGKVISVFSNAPGTAKGLGQGYFIPFP